MPASSRTAPARLAATERSSSRTLDLDTATPGQVATEVLREDALALAAATRSGDEVGRLADLAARVLGSNGRLLLVGAGTSGRLCALEAAECPPTFGVKPGRVQALVAGGRAALSRSVEGAEDDRSAGSEAVRRARVGASDLVVGVSASGGPAFVCGALQEARRRRAQTALLCCVPAAEAAAARNADLVLAIPCGAEVITGSTRMKAGSVQKAVLNAVTTAAFANLGHVHGSLMVSMQPTNQKLRRRARRIVQEITGVSPQKATAALTASGWDVKVACVSAALAIDTAAARARLRQCDERLRAVLEGPP